MGDQQQWTLPLRKVPPTKQRDNSVVWNNIYVSYEQRLFGLVTSCAYSSNGAMLGVTATNQLAVLRVPQSEGAVVNEQRERKSYSVRFRSDSRLYIQSVDQRVVVRSCETAFERRFLAHTRDVRDAIFVGGQNFVSGSDDTTVKLWDLLTEEPLASAAVHTDYVRCLEHLPAAGAFLSGSYDHSVNLWDVRAGLAAPVQTTGNTLGAAVETLCLCAVGGAEYVACAAGDRVLLFDTRAGLAAAPVAEGSHHTKAVTALAYSAAYRSLVTGSLDCRVKMFALGGGGLECVSTKRYDSAVTSLAVHPRSAEFVVGFATGDLNVFKFRDVHGESRAQAQEAEAAAVGATIGEHNAAKSEVLETKMHAVQHQLRTYQYGNALRNALYSRHPDVIVSTVGELVRRGVLHVALSGQNDRTVAQVLRFATEYLDRPQFCGAMVTVLEDIFAIYGPVVGRSAFLHREITIAQKRIGAILAALSRMEESAAVMEMIISASE